MWGISDWYRQRGKRYADVLLTLSGAPVVVPLTVFVAAGVALSLGRPVFFRQQRPGKDGKPFILVKFRTMRDLYDACGKPLPDDARMTSVGRFLRSSSLDELPTLWNVLWGDMSLVGPRPLLMRYLERYTPEQARRHEVNPGITGWAQINGRNALQWEDKFALDIWYVEHFDPLLDLKILAKTMLKVIQRDGIAADDHVSMPEFMGSTVASSMDS